jgi:hypothetical protein
VDAEIADAVPDGRASAKLCQPDTRRQGRGGSVLRAPRLALEARRVHHVVSMRYFLFVGFLGGLLAIATGGCGSGRLAPVNDGTSGSGDAGADTLVGDAAVEDAGVGVTFQLEYDGLLCRGSVCGENWLSIADSNGASVPFLPGLIQCSDCVACDQDPESCYLGCPIPPPSAGPETLVWNGGIYPASTCTGGMSCTTSAVAAAGTYTATMCFHPAGADGGYVACGVATQGAPNCKSFVFQWPPGEADKTITWSP